MTAARDKLGEATPQSKKGRGIWLVSVIPVVMFGFGFALVPLYGVYCKVVGANKINVPVAQAAVVADEGVVSDRRVTVHFDSVVNGELPWEFAPMQKQVTVRPGERTLVKFRVKNLSSAEIVGQAIPSITPWQTTPYLTKIECFCFNQQVLQPGEEKEMPLYFMVSKDIPEQWGDMILSYTFMKVKDGASKEHTAKVGTAKNSEQL